jgi:hypothetical protein
VGTTLTELRADYIQGVFAIIHVRMFFIVVYDIYNIKIKMHRTMYLLFCMDVRLRVFEKKVERGRREDVTGAWRKLHNEELRHLYSSLGIIRI